MVSWQCTECSGIYGLEVFTLYMRVYIHTNNLHTMPLGSKKRQLPSTGSLAKGLVNIKNPIYLYDSVRGVLEVLF